MSPDKRQRPMDANRSCASECCLGSRKRISLEPRSPGVSSFNLDNGSPDFMHTTSWLCVKGCAFRPAPLAGSVSDAASICPSREERFVDRVNHLIHGMVYERGEAQAQGLKRRGVDTTRRS